uniref:site-specific tyrosine recombinase/integron integrase n=1 Tax=Candidatus Ventrenecus sp. TaxID=3085654 RepID=UPI003FF0478C
MKNKVEEFLQYLTDVKMVSSNTVLAYQTDLDEFALFLKEHNLSYLSLTKEDVRTYLKLLDQEKFKNKSIARHLSALRSFYRYLEQKGVVENNVFEKIHNPKLNKPLPNTLNYEETEKLLHFDKLDTSWDIECHLVLELLYSTGLRASELSDIKIGDIYKSDRRITVTGKGQKGRTVYYGEFAQDALDKYLSIRPSLLKKENHDYLLVNQRGGKLSRSSIFKMIEKKALSSGINHHLSPHTLRHTFATHLLANGADIKTVQELLGHENLGTTEIYTHLSNSYLQEEYRNKMMRK